MNTHFDATNGVPPCLKHLPDEPSTGRAPKKTREAASSSKSRLPDVAYVILGFLESYSDGVHGYRLGRDLSESPLGLPSLQIGQLYRLLRRLERAGLVSCRIETESSRLRYRFSITAKGSAGFRKWLDSVPRGSGASSEELLDRLRFADRLAPSTLLSWIDAALSRCETELGELTKEVGSNGTNTSQPVPPYVLALSTRLTADHAWLQEARRIVEKCQAANTHLGAIDIAGKR